MAYSPNSLVTGLLGYSLRKEFLNDGLFYRETENYSYQINAIPSVGSAVPYTEIEALIKAAFAGYSGNLTVKNLSESADFTFPDDHIRVGKFQVDIEYRKPIANLSTYQTELDGNLYKGLNGTFWNSYGTYFNDFKEDFGVEISDNGNKNYSHLITFSLKSGDKSTATTIATSIFSNDKDTTFGISYLSGTGADLANTTNYQNYYSETYDLVRNSYSFTKRREVLPTLQTNYTYNLGHIISLKEDGVIDVSERGNIEGKIGFSDAQIGYGDLTANSYTRCNNVFSSYKDFVGGQTISEDLPNFALSSNRTLNKPNKSIEYEIVYSTNPILNAQSGILVDETIDISKSELDVIDINHTYSYNLLRSPVVAGLDELYNPLLINANNSSPAKISGVYAASTLYDSSRIIKKITNSANVGSKRKNLTISFGYSNNPTYFSVVDGQTYTILDTRLSESTPQDIINEYKIINRASKSSVLNYAYQTQQGSKTVSIVARLPRTAGNMITHPRLDISDNLVSLYKFAIAQVLQSLTGVPILALSYYLSDVKYRFNSDNEINVDIVVTYTIKKYKDS